MTPIHTSACNVVFTLEGCADLPACRGDGFLATYWKPDAEELAMIAAGFPIRLCVQGSVPQPVALDVEAL